MTPDEPHNRPEPPAAPPGALRRWIVPGPRGPLGVYCKDCSYDLGASLGARLCPECGRAFDTRDRSTYRRRPKPPRSGLAVRAAVWGAIGVVFVALANFTIIPRPTFDPNTLTPDFRLWAWLYEPYGVARAENYREIVEVLWWAGEIEAIRRRRKPNPMLTIGGNTINPNSPSAVQPQAPTLVSEFRELAPDRWRLEVFEAGLPSSELIDDFNSMRTDDQLFGVYLESAAGVRVPRSTGPFVAEGGRVEILTAIVDHYNFRIRPTLTGPEDELVWIRRPDTGVIDEVHVDEARALGFEVPAFGRPLSVRRHSAGVTVFNPFD